MKMKDITADYLEDFIRTTIRSHKLSAKAASFLHLVTKGIFVQGKKYTNFSIGSLYLEMTTEGFHYYKSTNKKKEVYTMDEARMIINYCLSHPDPWNLGIALCFYSGVRIGELSGINRLDFTDFDENGCTLTVQRTEAKVCNNDSNRKNSKTGKVAKTTKKITSPKTSSAFRTVEVTSKGTKIVRMLLAMNPDKEYLFVGRNGQRIGSSAFRERLKSICTKLGIEYAPPHKIRKTYASIKAVNGVGDAQNSKELGHADITTTKRLYEKDYFTKTERRKTNNMAVNY